MKKLLLIFIFAIGIATNASATKDTVTYQPGTTVVNGVSQPSSSATLTVNVGDTIVFQSLIGGPLTYMVNTASFPGITAMQYFQYKVVGADVPNFNVTATYMTFTQPVITVYVNSTASLDEKTKRNNLTLFPNPTKNTFSVASLKTATISVYNQLGGLVKQQVFDNENIALNIADLPEGLYMVEVVADGKRSVSKLIKE